VHPAAFKLLIISMFQSVATLLATPSVVTFACLAGAAGGIYLFFRGFILIRGPQPTALSKILKAPLGPVDAGGIAAGPHTITAPITGTACFAYRTVAWRQTPLQSGQREEMVAEEKLHIPFFLGDSTGNVLIDPAGADLDLRQDFRHEFQNSNFTNENPALKNVRSFLKRHSVEDGGRLRVEEFCIKPKNFLFVHATLAKNPGIVVAPQRLREQRPRLESPALESVIAPLPTFTAEFPVPKFGKPEGPNFSDVIPPVSRDLVDLTSVTPSAESSKEMTQQGKIAAALQRAGIIMPDIRALMIESDASPEAPTREVAPGKASTQTSGATDDDHAEAGEATKGEFELKPQFMLTKGKLNSKYVISWRDQRSATPMPWRTALMLWGGPALTLFSLSALAAHLGWL
jgi:E3 Ubiquitin ligase